MRFHYAERWPSGRRHQIANLAYWVTGTEGSNPSLSAKSLHFLALSIVVSLSGNALIGAGGVRVGLI